MAHSCPDCGGRCFCIRGQTDYETITNENVEDCEHWRECQRDDDNENELDFGLYED